MPLVERKVERGGGRQQLFGSLISPAEQREREGGGVAAAGGLDVA